ncbi:MAG: alpha/beta hydrolase fold domain-containing protein [Kiritimatiellae bacterium]|nr:alpha/beta hydrolase fold domain-containing protein [Kiritimatiellia bacterium]
MKKNILVGASLVRGAFAAALCLAAVSSVGAKTPEEVSKERRYPARYCADDGTPEARAALIEELWKHDSAADTKLWPEGKVPMKANDKPIRMMEHELWQRNLVVSDVNDPFFTFFPAAGEGAKGVVVILPGGGYRQLGWNKEGTEIAEWLNALGFSAAVLLYRAPEQRDAALCDVQRAIGILRRDAEKYSIDPGRVGVIGFSAGANLAIRASTNWRKRLYERVDDADDYPCRPDFQMPIYPWDIRFRNEPSTTSKGWKGMEIRPEYPVDSETPPAFIAQSVDDFCQIETTVTYDWHLRMAGVKSTARIYPNGGHGYGLRRIGRATDVWSDEAAAWLAQYAKPSKKVLFLGDSITDRRHIGCTKNYWGYLGDWYGFSPLVYGINGQQWSHIADQARAYMKDHKECPDVVFVFAGTNDYNSNVPLGEWYEVSDAKVNRNGREVPVKKRTLSMDGSTLRGRINSAMSFLRESFPKSRFVLLTPIHRGYAAFGAKNVQPDESHSNELGLFIDDYVEAVKEAGGVWAAKVVDINADSGLYPLSDSHVPFFSNGERDRLHPSASGHERIAEAISLAVGGILE